MPKEFVERDLFEAMVSLRRDLESANIKLLCAGARKDVWPSGMGRDMGAGVKAYITEMGKQATQLVCIFDRIPAEMVASVKEQRQHNEQWIEFFRKRRRDQGSH